MPRSRAWFGTVWRPEELERIKTLDSIYLLISHPDQTEDGQLHWHVYIYFRNPRHGIRQSEETGHWEPAQGNGAISYILAKGMPSFESGRRPTGFVGDINSKFREFLEFSKTHTPKELLDSDHACYYVKYPRAAGEMHDYYNRPVILDELVNEWWWGEPGTGKTRKAWEENPGLYVKNLNKWWDSYEDEEVVLLDDWDPNAKCLTQYLKTWSDRYPFRAEVKGASRLIRPKKIIVTSNYPIEECFDPTDAEAIRRRFKVTHFGTFP